MHSDKKGYKAIHAVSKSFSSLSNVKAAVASKQISKTGKQVTEESLGNENSDFADLQECKLKDFKVLRVLGTGSFGRVSLAKHVATGQVCAIKALSKKHILKNQQIEHLISERDVLRRMNFPFVIHLLTSFQDEAFVYFVLEYSSGGEFFRHLKAKGRLPEESAKFYAAEVLLALEYLHKQNIVYRDLKPENLLLDAKGFIKMTDFGFAKVITNSRTYTLCGTPDYLAPEVILNKGHSKPVDWWAYGVLLYEMIAGFPPFFDQDITNTYKKIVEGRFMFPTFFPPVARDLVRKLLQVDLSKRYGNLIGGIGDIKGHPWFKNIDWDTCLAKQSLAPIKPVVKAADDASNFDDYSALKPMQEMHVLSASEQLEFADF